MCFIGHGMIHIPTPVYPNYHRKSNSSFELRNKYTWNKSFSHKNSEYIDSSDILKKQTVLGRRAHLSLLQGTRNEGICR
jgi:hypothetical protein